MILAGNIDSQTIDNRLLKFDSDVGVLDLRASQFFTPGALVQIWCIGYTQHRKGIQPQVLLPNDVNVLNFLYDTDFLTLAQRYFQLMGRLPISGKDRNRRKMIRMHPIWEKFDLTSLNRVTHSFLYEELTETLKINREDSYNLSKAISELAKNIPHHAEAPGVICGQVWKQKGSVLHFQLAVGDGGRGILSSLSENPKLQYLRTVPNPDTEAIGMALKPGISRLSDSEARGEGLHDVVKAVEKLNGKIKIRSGSGAVTLSWLKQPVFSTPESETLPPFQGTLVEADLFVRLSAEETL